jgi:DNA processing protein
MDRQELAAWLRLTLAPGIGNAGARRLLAAFGPAPAVFEQSQEALAQVVGGALARELRQEPDKLAALLDATLAWRGQADEDSARSILTLGDPAYPATLLNTEDPPILLYALGQVPAQWPDAIAMVGSRNPTAQGMGNARDFAAAFARCGLTVVSGLALGVDAAAHEGALDGAAPGGVATVAVVGTGLDRVYPRQNLQLARRIARQGLILSEYPIGTPPLAPNFPKRNRLISALSLGTVVVEAALKSGSLITARQAVEQGKEVFAIPGSIHSPQSRGCHALIKQGAKLVETAQDVLEELPALSASTGRAAPVQVKNETPDDSERDGEGSVENSGESDGTHGALLRALGFDPVSLDALVARTGESTATLQVRLLELELEGRVARLPGGLFQRIGSA